MRREFLLLLALCGCHKPAADEAAAPVARKVSCAPVEQRATSDVVEVRGTVAPLADRDALVAPQVGGRLLKLEVREGDQVAEGQVVARIDDALLADLVHQADAALSRARAEAANAEKTLARTQQVFDRGIAPRQEVDDSATRVQVAKSAALEAEAAARTAHRGVERALVKSPLSGVVLKVLRHAGELVDGTPATPVVEIADLSRLELSSDVPAADLVRLERGAKATLTFPGLPDSSFTGAVGMVSPSVEKATGLGTVRITLSSEQAMPPVGLFGSARIERGATRQGLFVPRAALRAAIGGEGEVVICGADKLLHVIKVRVVASGPDSVEVSGELPADARVAVAPVLGLNEGDPLE